MADTYPLQPNRLSTVKVEFATLKTEFDESQYIQRQAKRSTPKRTFRLTHELLNEEELALLVDFFIEKKGAFQKFYFHNHIDDVDYECVFASDELSVDHVNVKFANVELELETC